MQNASIGIMLVGNASAVSFQHSFTMIKKERDFLESVFLDFREAFDKMNILFMKPRTSIDVDGRLNVEFSNYFSQEFTQQRDNAVRECRWQAQRLIEEATKLNNNADFYLRLNWECLNRLVPPTLFLTPRGKQEMTNHCEYSVNLISSAKYVLTKL